MHHARQKRTTKRRAPPPATIPIITPLLNPDPESFPLPELEGGAETAGGEGVLTGGAETGEGGVKEPPPPLVGLGVPGTFGL